MQIDYLIMLLEVCATVCSLLLAAWAWFQWTHRDLLRAARQVPYLYCALPIVGHAHFTLFGIEKLTRWAMEMSLEAMSKGLYTICFWCGPLPFIMVHDRNDIQKILNSSRTFEKGHEYKYLKFAAGEGLLTAPGHVWRITRRHINPLFQQGNIDRMMYVFNRNTVELERLLEAQLGRGPVNLVDHTVKTALKNVCHLIFGAEIEFDIQSKSFNGLVKVVESIPEILTKRFTQLWCRNETIFKIFYKTKLDTINQFWKKFTDETLTLKRESICKNENKSKDYQENILTNEEHYSENCRKEPLSLLQVYRELQNINPSFTENELKSEMITLYATGSDTVGVAVASLLLILAYHQDIQERLHIEIASVVDRSDEITHEDLNRMPYLDQVFKENLRWSSMVPFIVRRTTDEIKLSSCTVPAGHSIILCLAGVHMDPKVYPDPRVFDPERFSTENSVGRNKNSFVPFSGGPRNCIGKLYAELLTKVMVARLLRRFRLTTKTDIYNMRRKISVVLTSAEGYHVTLHERSG